MASANQKELDECVRKNVAWSDMPIHLKQVLQNTPREYDKYIVHFSLKNQQRFRGNLVRHTFRNEKRYYELLVEKSVQCLSIFPYHLADIVTKGLRVTPFNYYLEIVALLLRTDRSYDTLPNFTAIDCLRVLGVGRNEYLALIAELKTNAPKLFRRPNPMAYLPRFPIAVTIEHWWKVEVGFVLESDIRGLSDEERALIDDLIDFGSLFAGQRDYQVVHSLYRKGLVYVDVPISGEDKISIPPLKNFVMNRVNGDDFENLLYKIFVSADEYTTIGELSQMLQIDLDEIKQAVSLFCRLGFAQKKTNYDIPNGHASWEEEQQRVAEQAGIRPRQVTPLNYHALLMDEAGTGTLQGRDTRATLGSTPEKASDEQTSSSELSDSYVVPVMERHSPPSPSRGGKRMAFLFDSTLTAFLMMGNLSPGLKNHAVTMFEVGKLSDESLDEFLGELEKVSLLDAEGEGEVGRYFAHAVFLRSTIISLRSVAHSGLDLLRLECLEGLDKNIRDRLLATKYKCIVSAAPLTSSFSSVLPVPFFGQFYRTSDNSNFWLKLFYYHLSGFGPPSLLLTKGHVLHQLPRMFLGYGSLLVTIVNTDSYVLNTNNFKSVNKQLRNSCVLVQAYGLRSAGELHYESFPFDESDTTPTRSTFAQHRAIGRMRKHLNFTNTCGYVTFLKTGVRDIGCDEDVADVCLQRPQRRKSSTKGAMAVAVAKKAEEARNHIPGTKSDCDAPQESKDTSVADVLSPNDDVDISTFQQRFAQEETVMATTGDTPRECSDGGSPANEYRSADCNELLESELDTLTGTGTGGRELISQASIEIPIEGSVGTTEENVYEGEEWTVLEVQFGVPLFDFDCNTRICQGLAKTLLSEENLSLVNACNMEMNEKFMKFVHQCLYFEDEGMDLVKAGKLIPQPRHNLVFDYGKVGYWAGK